MSSDQDVMKIISGLSNQVAALSLNQKPSTKADNANYFASSSEIPAETLQKYFGFLNKDVATTVLSKNEILADYFKLKAILLTELMDMPSDKIPADYYNYMENILAAYWNRANKSNKEHNLMITTLENREQTTVKTEQPATKNKWGIF
ncbi:hypothetical protein [Methanococcus maripaludis]|uniref:Uncharacterized protein n=1 Tax=Methanococcus maripaludis TaxID=39152 RepID=A0A7J9PME9_METMI|nr:hypothetical protein [Methanococcus maripaludis]MBA2863998.1 hypothetical protein [Methanococcus maripaludis]